MSRKSLVMLGMIVGSAIGSYAPALFGVSLFSFTSILLGGVGGILGIWLAYKITN